MDLAQEIANAHCVFCAKDASQSILSNMNTITSLIGTETIDFSTIVFDVVQRKLKRNQINFICEDCNNLMIKFYVFKNNALNNVKLLENKINKLVKKVDSLLEECGDEEVKEITFNKCLILIANSEQNLLDHIISWQPRILIENTTVPLEKKIKLEDPIEIKNEPLSSDSEGSFNENRAEFYVKTEYKADEKCTRTEKPKSPDKITKTRSKKSSTATEVKQRKQPRQLEKPKKRKEKRNLLNACSSCGYKLSSKPATTAHQKFHKLFENVAPLIAMPKCEVCRCVFSNENDYNSHLLNHQLPDFSLKPIAADGVILDASCLRVSLRDQEIEINDDIAWNCGHCTRKFADEIECKKHQMMFHFTCYVCPLDSRTFDKLPASAFLKHVTFSHPEFVPDNIYICTYCSSEFVSNPEKLVHMKLCSERKFSCDYCGKKFFEKHTMTMHLRIHAGSLVYSCEICGKSTANSYDLQNHLRSHTSETPFKCSLCPKAYKTSSARGSHMQTHQEGSHTCPYCGVKFKKREKYKSHIKFFHDEIFRAKRFSELTCSFCNKAFLEKYLYADHMRKAHQVFSGSAAALNKKEGIPSDNDD